MNKKTKNMGKGMVKWFMLFCLLTFLPLSLSAQVNNNEDEDDDEDEITVTDNKGREEVRWFASNLTEDDLALISPDFEIEIKGSEATDSITTVSYYAKNVIICDSLETKGHLGERSIKVTLKNEGGNWKVDKLKW